MKEPTAVLLTDIDNTLYDFVDFYGMAFRGMVHVLSGQLQVPEERLILEFKDIFKTTGTLDYQFLIKDLKSAQHLDKNSMADLIRYGRIGFDRAKRKRLQPYPGMIEALRLLRRGGVSITAVTNAPYYHAIRRLQDIGAFQFFSGLVAWEGKPPPSSDKSALARYKAVREFARGKLEFFELFSREMSKPHSYPFFLTRQHVKQNNIQLFALGDSISKDLAPTSALGAVTIWARYGTKVDKKNLDTILDITPWSESEIARHSDGQSYSPNYTIDAPLDLLPLIPHWKSDLFQ